MGPETEGTAAARSGLSRGVTGSLPGPRDRWPVMMQMAGVSHIAVLKPFDPAVVADPRRFDQIEPVDFLRTNNSGRYYFADSMLRVHDVHEAAELMASSQPIAQRTALVADVPFAPARGVVERAREYPPRCPGVGMRCGRPGRH